MRRRHVHLIGWGHALPKRIVTNADLTDFLDTSDDWIASRTGIRERRIATDSENTSCLGAAAAAKSLARAGMAGSAVDAVICATSTPDCLTPSTACLIQEAIGARGAFAFDVSAGCTGFLFGLRTGCALIRDGAADTVVVVGAETMSRVVDWSDRATSVLFGDGAGAVVLRASRRPGGLQDCHLGSDGRGASLISIGIGTRRQTTAPQDDVGRRPHVELRGAKVYAFASRTLAASVTDLLSRADVSIDAIDWFVPHQANLRIIRSAAHRLGLAEDRIFVNIERYANTAAASVPLALCEIADSGQLAPGDRVVLAGVGSGLTWAAALVEWTAPAVDVREPGAATLSSSPRKEASLSSAAD